MYAKIQIKGELELQTGMHIGVGDDFSAIGIADSLVIRDVITQLPIIPGSSLKGKIRYLLARKYNKERGNGKADSDDIKVRELFGASSGTNKGKASRVIFSDSFLMNEDDLEKWGVDAPTEIKMENNIDRLNGKANPRQIERSIRGSKFELDIIYNVEELEVMESDLELLSEGFRMLEFDYLGGHGSRGYGRVKIKKIDLKVVWEKESEKKLEGTERWKNCQEHFARWKSADKGV